MGLGICPAYAIALAEKESAYAEAWKKRNFNRINRTYLKDFETSRGPRLKQMARRYHPPLNPFQRGLQQRERRQQELREASGPVGLVTEVFDSVIQSATAVVDSTVIRAPTPKKIGTAPLPPIQEEENVLDKMDTPVHDWVLSDDPPPETVHVVAEVHPQERAITPEICSPCSTDIWVGTPTHPGVGDTPTQTPTGTPSSTPSRRRRTPTPSPRES